jgi:hypothetical protein
MIGHNVFELLEPEVRYSRECDPFSGDWVGKYYVECRDSVTRDNQQVIWIDAIDVAHFSTGYKI